MANCEGSSAGKKAISWILALALVYFSIVFIEWMLPSSQILDSNGDVDNKKLFGYSAAIFAVLVIVGAILSMLGKSNTTTQEQPPMMWQSY